MTGMLEGATPPEAPLTAVLLPDHADDPVISPAEPSTGLVAAMRGWSTLAARLCHTPIGFFTVTGPGWSSTTGVAISARRVGFSLAHQTAAEDAARHAIARQTTVVLDNTVYPTSWSDIETVLIPIPAVLATPIPHGVNPGVSTVIGVQDTIARNWSTRDTQALARLAVTLAADQQLHALAASPVDGGMVARQPARRWPAPTTADSLRATMLRRPRELDQE